VAGPRLILRLGAFEGEAQPADEAVWVSIGKPPCTGADASNRAHNAARPESSLAAPTSAARQSRFVIQPIAGGLD
jgi:hypothetical protein